MIELPPDVRDILIELYDAGADFVVVGGHAVAFHGHPRATKDLDVLVRADPRNASRVYQALAAFGAPLERFEVGESDFATYDGVLQIGLPPRRIDILNRASGITFDEALAGGEEFDLDGRSIRVIGFDALIKNKTAAAVNRTLPTSKLFAASGSSAHEKFLHPAGMAIGAVAYMFPELPVIRTPIGSR